MRKAMPPTHASHTLHPAAGVSRRHNPGRTASWGVPVLAVLLAYLLCLPTLAQPAGASSALTVGQADSYNLSSFFDVLEDPTAALTFDDILKPQTQQAFRPVKPGSTATNFGLTHSAFWLRITLGTQSDTPATWLFEVAYPPLNLLELYSSRLDGGFDHQKGGDLRAFADRPIPHRNHVLPVTLTPGKSSTLYLRIASQGTVSAPVRLWKPGALWAHDQVEYSVLSLYFGLLIGLFLYNLLLFISLHDRVYLFYVAFVAWIAMSQAALTGMGAQLIWPQWPWWIAVSISASNAMSGVFGILFARDFLSSSQSMPRLDRLLRLAVALWVVAFASALLLPYVISVWMVTLLALLTVTSLVVVGIFSVRRKHPGARYFLYAWTVLLIGVTILALHNTGWLPSNVFTANSLMIGSAFEMVLLSFGLANRVNIAIVEKEQAQARSQVDHAMVEALSKSQERYRAVLQERETVLATSIVGIVFLTSDGRFRWANQAMMDILSSSDEKVTTMEPFYRSREEYLRVGGEVAACIARGEVYQTELEVRQGNGNLIWVSLSGKAVVKCDLTQGTVWVMTDISLRKALEAELIKTLSEREAILNSALVGIVLSVNRRHEWVNEKFAQMMGYPREEMIGQSSATYHRSREAWNEFGVVAKDALLQNGTFTAERELVRRNGEVFWVQLGGSCIRPGDPSDGIIWTFLDITERKKSGEEMREALAQQRELNELRSRFVAMTSHEFRTPLASILSAQELLRHYGDRLDANEKGEILESIAAGVQSMVRMLDRVLVIGKADAQMLEFAPKLQALAPLCEDVLEEARLQHATASCSLRLQLPLDAGQGWYDEKLFRHVFSNLLSNAIKYSPQGGEVLFAVSLDAEHAILEVSDHGIGIPSDEIGHLFESFHRASNVGDIQGTGLGLAIAKNAVTIHGGTIEVSSSPNNGTHLKVRLPKTLQG
jgi:PAS domain S-box-containing protein